MANTIQIKRSSTAGDVPTTGDLAQGELAVNLPDRKIYTKDNNNAVVQLNPVLDGFRNRIINGDMRIDQRNAGAAVTITADATYTLDRWRSGMSQASKYSVQQNAGTVTPPTGFTNYLGITSLSAYSITSGDVFNIAQRLEGFNTADIGWGTSSAQAVTLSFWVRSSLTGSFGGALTNSARTRSYPFTYTVSSTNTWEQKTITIAGDTSGTWLTTNGIGILLSFGLGIGSTFSGTAGAWAGAEYYSATGAVSVVGTSGATFYITGVQLEAGSVATPFERRPYGTELALCQRYYFKMQATGANAFFGSGLTDSTTTASGIIQFPVSLRTAPTALEQSGTAGHYQVAKTAANIVCTSVPFFAGAEIFSARATFTTGGSLVAGQASILRSVDSSAFLAWSAEL
jgi:hypothetical protein